jgi:uncharacterized membrane protein YidH (DUF202 family)
MKKIFLATLFVIACNNLFAQKLNDSLLNLNNEELGNYYLKKSKKQKTAAWVMMGGGLALATIGAGISMSQFEFNLFDSQPSSSVAASDVLAVTGALIAVGSIPLFIAGAKNKKRAKLLIGNQPVSVTRSVYLRQNAIGLVISLGR